MIGIGGFDEDPACMMMRRLRNRFGGVVFERCAGATKTIEGNDMFNEEAAWHLALQERI